MSPALPTKHLQCTRRCQSTFDFISFPYVPEVGSLAVRPGVLRHLLRCLGPHLQPIPATRPPHRPHPRIRNHIQDSTPTGTEVQYGATVPRPPIASVWQRSPVAVSARTSSPSLQRGPPIAPTHASEITFMTPHQSSVPLTYSVHFISHGLHCTCTVALPLVPFPRSCSSPTPTASWWPRDPAQGRVSPLAVCSSGGDIVREPDWVETPKTENKILSQIKPMGNLGLSSHPRLRIINATPNQCERDAHRYLWPDTYYDTIYISTYNL